MADSTSFVIWAAVGLVLALALGGLLARAWRDALKRRSARLEERFGPEYQIAVERYGASRAVRELEARERRVEKLPLRSLAPAEREGFAQSWQLAQQQFVTSPEEAVQNAHELVQRTMYARGYPAEDFEECVADLSVDYGEVVQHYRAAHAIDEARRAGRASTEELRQAIVCYRALFEELLGTPPEQPPPLSRRFQPVSTGRGQSLPR